MRAKYSKVDAEAARHSIRGNGVVAQAARGLITHSENQARFTVGVVGGLAKEAVGLVGTVGTIGTSVAELQLSRSARAELGHTVSSLAHQGGAAVTKYTHAVVADPSRVGRDLQAAGAATEKAVSGFVGSETKRYEEAIKRGEGIETVGMTTGQILSYVIPVGAGGKAAATAARGVEGLAAGGARADASLLRLRASEAPERMFSSSAHMGVQPASAELLASVSSKRSVIIAKPGSDELRMLDYFGAEASVSTSATGVRNVSILLRENPSKAAVLEEFLHGTQARLGIVDRLGESGLGSAETHVKDFMIRHQKNARIEC